MPNDPMAPHAADVILADVDMENIGNPHTDPTVPIGTKSE